MSGSMCVEMGLCGGNDGSVEGETGGVEEDCVSVCVWRYRVVERDGCVAVEKGQVCMCVCVQSWGWCVWRDWGVRVCVGVQRLGLGVALQTWVWLCGRQVSVSMC